MKTIYEIKNFIDYVKNYKENIKKLDNISRDIGNLKYDIKKLQEALALGDEQINNYLKKIGDKNKQIRELKKQNIFLIERENKLQKIEILIKNKATYKEIKGVINEL